MSSTADPAAEVRLGVLLERFENRKRAAPELGIGVMFEEAGKDFPMLADLARCWAAIQAACGEFPAVHPPRAIGRYRILALVGRGASGDVYQARDESNARDVAVKWMRSDATMQGERGDRFLREFELARRLDDPAFVSALAWGQDRGRLYLVLEFIPGGSLEQLLDALRRAAPHRPDHRWHRVLDAHRVAKSEGSSCSEGEAYARRIASLFAPVAHALHRAHADGLVHRDVKPGNLLIDASGRLRLADLGLAKLMADDVTSAFAILGTPAYMSPEQARGESRAVDARTDVYGLGAAMFGALTLRGPVRGDGLAELFAAIQRLRPPPISRFCAEYPAGLVRIVERCLEKDPRDRYPDAAVLGDDLDCVARGLAPQQARPRLPARCRRAVRRHRWVAPVLLIGIAGPAAWWTWSAGRTAWVEVRTYPRAQIRWNGNSVQEGHWTGPLPSGRHDLEIVRPGFRLHRESLELESGERLTIRVHLVPVDPFDVDSLNELARSCGIPEIPDRPIVSPRGRPHHRVDLSASARPSGLGEWLTQFDSSQRALPHVQLLAAAWLHSSGEHMECYRVASTVAASQPDRRLPMELALLSLQRLGHGESEEFADLYDRLGSLER